MKSKTLTLLLSASLAVISTYASTSYNAICDTVIMKDEVTVTAQFIEQKNDRIVVTFKGNPLAKNASAWDMLYRIPGCWGLTLYGKHIDRIYIDGRELQLPTAEWADYLQSLDTSIIESCEFSTAADSGEKEGSSGTVLYINLIENKTAQTGARINVGLEESFRFLQKKPTTIPTLNMVIGNNKFSSYTYFQHLNNGSEYLTQKDQRFYYNGSDTTRYIRETTSDLDRNTFIVDQSFAYHIDENNQLEANFNGFFTPENMKWYTGKTTVNETALLFSDTSADTVRTKQSNMSAYAAYTHRFDTIGSTLKASVEYTYYQLHSTRNDEQFYPDHTHTLYTESDYTGHAISPAIDLHFATRNHLSYTAGARYLYTYRNTDFLQQESGATDLLKPNDTHESIYAAYGNIIGEWERIYFKAGLRIEYCDGTYRYAGNQQSRLQEWAFLPSATLQFTENERLGHSLSLHYNTSVLRPNAALLDPTLYKRDELTYMAGNADLRSSYTHSLQLQQTLWNELTIALSADWRLHNIEETFTPSATDARVYTFRPMNYGYNHRYGLSAYYDKTFFSIWHINANASVSLLQEDSYNYGKQQSLSFGVGLHTQVMLPRDWSVAAEGYFRRIGRELGFKPDDEYSCSASVTKSFCNDRISLSLAFREIYYNMAPFSRLYIDKYVQLTSDDIYLEQIVLTFRYRFDLGKKGIDGKQIEASGASKSRF